MPLRLSQSTLWRAKSEGSAERREQPSFGVVERALAGGEAKGEGIDLFWVMQRHVTSEELPPRVHSAALSIRRAAQEAETVFNRPRRIAFEMAGIQRTPGPARLD